ncbi:hypothetical protein U3A98_003968 [Cronobacter turicensis]|nr:hypothetical protein [Cronobacter turicensis]
MDNVKLLVASLKQNKVNGLMLVFSFLVSWCSYGHFNFNDAKDILGTLINISAAIFTIVGLWVGILYPNAMSRIVNDDVSYIKNEKDSPRVEQLVYTLISSALVMIGILIFFLLRAYLYKLDLYKMHINLFRYIGMTYVTFLSWVQLKCVFSLVITNLNFVNQLYGRLSKAKMDHDED